MPSEEKVIGDIVAGVGEYLVTALEPILRSTVEAELGKALDKALRDGEFYKYVSEDLRKGVSGLFKEIANFKKEAGGQVTLAVPDTRKAEEALSEASSQLDYIFKSTEEAAENILNIIEKNLATQEKILDMLEQEGAKGLSSGTVEQLKAMNREVQNDYIEVMTALSFQDLTGQRIRKVIDFLSFVENNVLRMLVSTGIKIKEKEASPDKDVEEIISEAEARVDTALKGPQATANQGDIDNLLADLGL